MIDGIPLGSARTDATNVTEDELVPDGEVMEQPQDYDENTLQNALIRTREQFVEVITERFGDSVAEFGIQVVEEYYRQRMQGVVPSLQHLQQELQDIIADPNERKDFFEQAIAQLITEPVEKAACVSNLSKENKKLLRQASIAESSATDMTD